MKVVATEDFTKDWEKLSAPKYALLRFLKNIADIPREIKWFWQRGRRGYSDCDVWGFDTYLAKVIPGGLRALRDLENSHPALIPPKEWMAILTNIADEIERANKQYEEGVSFTKKDQKRLTLAFWKLGKHFFHLWD
jgi:hypothetical protein|tara:strand:- start:51 stop:458 length:408 start_codon:yes stop_codon:yes gene_type:complete